MSLTLEYVAGLFDGEGWCRIQTPGMNPDGIQISGSHKRHFPSYQVIAGIAMTYKPIMTLLLERFDGILYGDDHYRRKDPKNRTIYRWHVTSRKAYTFLSAIRPYSIIKLDQIELCLELQDHIDHHKSTMRWSTPDFRAEIAAHRKALADRITSLKKVNFNLPVDHGATPYRILSGKT